MSTEFKQGELVLLENGEYSDKSWSGPYKVLKDFEMREAAQTFKDSFVKEDEWDRADPFKFEGWLTKNGYVEQIECRSVHIGSYGDVVIDG